MRLAKLCLFSMTAYFSTSMAWAYIPIGYYESLALINSKHRPTIAQVSNLISKFSDQDLIAAGQLPLTDWMHDDTVKNAVLKEGPRIVATFETVFPGATYLALGRDAALLGDLLDATGNSVRRINASGPSIEGLSDEKIVQFLKDTTGLDLNSLDESPGWVIFDATRWNPESQSRTYLKALANICLKLAPRCDLKKLAEKVSFLNTGTVPGNEVASEKIVGVQLNHENTREAIEHFYRIQASDPLYKLNASDIIGVSVPEALLYTTPFHGPFDKVSQKAGLLKRLFRKGRLDTGTEETGRTTDRKQVVVELIDIVKAVATSEFKRDLIFHRLMFRANLGGDASALRTSSIQNPYHHENSDLHEHGSCPAALTGRPTP